MSEYSDPEGWIVCDFQYTLKQAVLDSVCRSPKIVLVDNGQLSVTGCMEKKSFSSILDLLKHSNVSYQSIIHNDEAIKYVLDLSCERLASIRKINPNAGGLVVAASVDHAKKIQRILVEQFKQTTEIVTYKQDNPLQLIDHFRHGTIQWVVSVGMISEGTDIPRLQVCCHLSAVKTELYFRQVLGRILRVTKNDNQEAWLYTFAEESLIRFAEQIEQDIPESCMYIKQRIEDKYLTRVGPSNLKTLASNNQLQEKAQQKPIIHWNKAVEKKPRRHDSNDVLHSATDLKLGQFKARVIAAFM